MDQKLPDELTEEHLKYKIEGKIHKVFEDSDTFRIVYILHDKGDKVVLSLIMNGELKESK